MLKNKFTIYWAETAEKDLETIIEHIILDNEDIAYDIFNRIIKRFTTYVLKTGIAVTFFKGVNMKKIIVISVLPVLLLAFTACGAKKSCNMSQMEFSFGAKVRVMHFTYESGKLASSHAALKDGSKDYGTSEYAYDEKGKVVSVSDTAYGDMKFSYDANGQVSKIVATHVTVKFERDDKGQIVTENLISGGRSMGKKTYEYNGEGVPVKSLVYDYKGKLYTTNEYSYDDKPSPFVGVYSGNSFQLLFGFPVGHAKHNLIKVVETYAQNIPYKINGVKWKKGQQDVQELSLTYNEEGYPTGEVFQDTDSMAITYICGESK
ncbi:MAG: type II toxin-antitoxin system RelE/ParE family toxin [Leptospirales bacterium]